MMPTKKSLPRLTRRCPLCRSRPWVDNCVCGVFMVGCVCLYAHRSRKRAAILAWKKKIAAKRKARKVRR